MEITGKFWTSELWILETPEPILVVRDIGPRPAYSIGLGYRLAYVTSKQDFPECLLILLSYLFLLFSFSNFLVVGSVRQIKLIYITFWAQV